jgi:hypothetical protein
MYVAVGATPHLLRLLPAVRRAAVLIVMFIAMPIGIYTSTVGCSQPTIPTSAIAVAQGVAQTATTIVADAQSVWPVIYAAIPASQQAAAQTVFNGAIFTANHAILALDDAISAAIAANNTTPNFAAIYSSLADAVAQVVAIVQQFTGPSDAGAVASVRTTGGVDVLADMKTAAQRIKTVAGK